MVPFQNQTAGSPQRSPCRPPAPPPPRRAPAAPPGGPAPPSGARRRAPWLRGWGVGVWFGV